MKSVTYRPELDGIRAVAVLLVVGAHLELPGFATGGYVGVTLFFVLSGYLITTILRSELERTGTIGVRGFYLRRARRLLPALALVIAVAGGLTIALGGASRVIGDLLPVALYFSNIARANGADLGWLPHAWSLSVEEQFYLVWPAVLLIARRRLWLVCVLGIVGAFLVRLTAGSGELQFGTFARGDAILYGALLAVSTVRWPRVWPLAAALLALVTVTTVYPLVGWIPTVVAGASMLLVAAPPAFLAWRPLVEIGKRSYGIYLWHWLPIVIVAPLLPSLGWSLAAITFTGVVAWASYRWIEQPVRRWAPGRSRRLRHEDIGGAGRRIAGVIGEVELRPNPERVRIAE